MSMRIGEVLVRKGLVSTQQLDEALEQQSETGGVLGASLLELGFVDERALGQTLAEQHRVRCAPPGMLRDIQEPAKKALSRPLLWKHRSVPFKLAGGTLHLLVADIHNLSGLSSKTGYRIVPWLAPEVRVHRELHRHFRIPLSSRYAEIARRLDEQAAASAAEPGEESIEPLGDRLAQAEDVDDAASIVLDHAAEQMAHCILFRIKEEEARIWDLRGHTMSPEARSGFVVSAVSGNPLELLAVHPSYRGAVPDEPAYRRFFSELGLRLPRDVALVPIEVAGRRVAILYGDAGADGEIAAPFTDQLQLGRKLVLAMTMVLIRNKIRE